MELYMIGNVYGRLTVVEYAHSDKKYNKFYKCKCACGKEAVVRGTNLTNKKTKSCGCYAEEFRQTLVDKSKQERRHITHKSYTLMMQRCYQTNHRHYSHFGAEGIEVCDRWRYGENNKTGWECFFEDMGPKPLNYALGRKDKLGPFNKDNCKWTTSNNQFADVMRSGRPRKEVKEDKVYTEKESWIRRCLAKPNRKALSPADVEPLMVSHCPLMGMKLTYVPSNNTGITRNYATLDRIDSSKGYIVGNIQIVSHRANMLKNDATPEEIALLAKNMRVL
jgi:hypothetical protein